MSREQPNLREAARLMRILFYNYEYKKGRWPNEYWDSRCFPIVSNIESRCHDCKCILIERRDAPGQWILDVSEKTNLFRGRSWKHRIDVCLGCYNKRRPHIKAALDWNETRLFINRIERQINEQRKNNIAAS